MVDDDKTRGTHSTADTGAVERMQIEHAEANRRAHGCRLPAVDYGNAPGLSLRSSKALGLISDGEIHELAVIDARGLAIGEVDCVLMNCSTWHVDAIRVRLRREVAKRMGATGRFFRRATIDIPTSLVQSVGDAVLLLVKADDVRQTTYSAQSAARTL